MQPSKKHAANPAVTQKLKAAKKQTTIIPVNTKPEDWVDKETVMSSFRFSQRTMQYYHAKGILPYSKLDKRIYYYLPGILQILEQNLHY